MRTNSYDTAIREVYNERANDTNIIGFVDIGKIADNVMTNDVRTVYNTAIQSGKNEIEARAKAQEQKNKEAEKPKAHKKGDVEL